MFTSIFPVDAMLVNNFFLENADLTRCLFNSCFCEYHFHFDKAQKI